MTHTTMSLTLNDEVVKIDSELGFTIEKLWAAGYPTDYCCQGSGPDRPGYISFDLEDGLRFVEKIGIRKIAEVCLEVDLWNPKSLVIRFKVGTDLLPLMEML